MRAAVEASLQHDPLLPGSRQDSIRRTHSSTQAVSALLQWQQQAQGAAPYARL